MTFALAKAISGPGFASALPPNDVFSAIANIFRHQTLISLVIEVLVTCDVTAQYHIRGRLRRLHKTDGGFKEDLALKYYETLENYRFFFFFYCGAYYRNTTFRNLQLLFHTVIGESPALSFVFSH